MKTFTALLATLALAAPAFARADPAPTAPSIQGGGVNRQECTEIGPKQLTATCRDMSTKTCNLYCDVASIGKLMQCVCISL